MEVTKKVSIVKEYKVSIVKEYKNHTNAVWGYLQLFSIHISS